MMKFKDYWNNSHKIYSTGKITYDLWLDHYPMALSHCQSEVLDLGCGIGNDTLYLKERGFSVVAVDYSEVALDHLKEQLNDVKTMQLDISLPLPFPDSSFDLIIADLSLHYFDEKTTIEIMKELKRILTIHGHLLARVNSLEDKNYGAGKGEKIEENYYFVDGYNKRFFSIEDAKRFFSYVGTTKVKETDMLRYQHPKKVLEIDAEKIS